MIITHCQFYFTRRLECISLGVYFGGLLLGLAQYPGCSTHLLQMAGCDRVCHSHFVSALSSAGILWEKDSKD